MPKVGLREALFSANCFVAAMLALFVSFSLGLDRPFWAMATVYITSQPLSGAVRSKAVYRLAGTAIGGMVTVLLVPTLVDAPVLLSLALALWVAGCQFVSLLDRTPRAYLFMLAGYTAALIGFPAVARPEAIFDIAVLRVQEIGIGVLCASLVHSLVFPRSVSAVFGARAKTVLAEAEAWIADVLAAGPATRTGRERRRLAADVTDLHVTASHIPFDTARIRPTRAMLTGLQDRLVQLIPLVSAVEDRMRELTVGAKRGSGRTSRPGEQPGFPGLDVQRGDPPDGGGVTGASEPPRDAVVAVRAWVLDPALPRPRVAMPSAAADWSAMLRLNLATITPAARPLHRDYGLALLSATATLLTVLGCCLFWIVTGWPEGAVAAMIAAVVCCFFATLDDPVPAQRGFLIWTIASLPLAAVYLFAVLPAVHGFVMLSLALAPPLLALGTMMAIPAWYGRMMPMLIGFASGLALTNIYAVDAAGFFNSNIAQVVGVAAAMMTTRLIRSIGAGTAIHRLRCAGWRDLAALAERPAQLPTWRSRMVDRIGLLAARIGEVEDEERDAAAAALRELRMGLSLAQLAADPHNQPLAQALGRHFRDLAHGHDAPPPPALLDRIDRAIGQAEPAMLADLVGLRRNVFPTAPAWVEARIAA